MPPGCDPRRPSERSRSDPYQLAADFANGSASRATYDPLDRVSSITNLDGRGKTASRFAYSYDPLGNLTSERAGRGEDGHASTGQDTGATTYRYDALSRLVAVAGGEHDRTTYRYDAVGNRIAAVAGDDNDKGALGATFDAADQLTALVRSNGTPAVQFSYDANGNLLTRTGADDHAASFSYDAADRLTTVADPEQGTTSYRYDGDGTLLSETVTNPRARDEDHRPASPVTLQYTIDQAAPLSQILSATDGQAAARYLYGSVRIASQGTTTRYYGTDVRGSVRSVTDGSGKRVGTRGYDAWGIPTEVDATDHGRDGRTDLAALFGYTGERQDASTGLVYLRARWYEPTAGRFLTRDPFRGTASDPRSLSPYAYAQNNPTSRVDPSGFSASSLFDSAPTYAYVGTTYYTQPAATPTQSGWDAALGAGKGFGGKLIEKGWGLVTGTVATAVSAGQYCVQHAFTTPFAFLNPVQGCAQAAVQDAYQNRNAIGRGLAYGAANYVGRVGDDLVSGDPERIAGGVTEVFFDVALLGTLKMPAGAASKVGEVGGAARAATGAGRVEDAAGIVYRRTDLVGGKPYIGQAKSDARFLSRQAEHARANPDADFEFGIIGRAKPGTQLDRLEEYFIRMEGGPTNLRNPDGLLANLRHQMSDARYWSAGGDKP
ncbi:MAG TPA: RHS repeat-associated core domain-containing protein [Candidatus Limnocylindria bacterium]|nr:RHS repeat-associated core domain-containing protein [Candidatus Limnocylindria bacterium]